jgi:hypothetical protein
MQVKAPDTAKLCQMGHSPIVIARPARLWRAKRHRNAAANRVETSRRSYIRKHEAGAVGCSPNVLRLVASGYRNADCHYCYSSHAGSRADRRGAAAEIRGRRLDQFNDRLPVEPRHGQRFVAHHGTIGCGLLRDQPGLVMAGELSATSDLDHQYGLADDSRNARSAVADSAPRTTGQRRSTQPIAKGNPDITVRPRHGAELPAAHRTTGAAIKIKTQPLVRNA